MSHIFEKCRNLKYLDLSSFRINKKVNMSNMFIDCLKLYEEFLKREDFQQLQQLYIRNNEISNIKIIEREYFKQLQYLYLSRSGISDIEVLEKVDIKQLLIMKY